MSSTVTLGSGGVLSVGGRPFFPLGARHVPAGATPRLLRRTGFNALRWVAFTGGPGTIPATPLPKDLGGLMFYPYLSDRADFSRQKAQRRRALAALVRQVRGHDALLCYEQRNEPASQWRAPARPQSPAAGMIAGSDFIRRLDPQHPIRVGHMTSNLVATLRRYNPAVDIVGCNTYVVDAPGHRLYVGCRQDGRFVDSPNQTLSAVGDMTTKMVRVAEGRPVWMQIQAMANEDWFSLAHTPENAGSSRFEHTRLVPNRWQLRFMAYHAILRGATGLEFAMYGLSVSEPAWLGVRDVIGELGRLHGVLAAPAWPGKISLEYRELGFSDWTGVEILVKQFRGHPWIIAANTQADPMEATFAELPPGVGRRLAVVGEGRSLAVRAGRFRDYFRPYEVHVYGPAGSAP